MAENPNQVNQLTHFYRELRRRQVFGVVALYAVAAWAVIEVGDMAIESGFITGLTTRNLFMLAVIGFPLVLIAGWFYNVTRQGVFRTAPSGAAESFDRKLKVGDYLLLLALLALWSGAYVYIHTPPPTEKSIAVMPFENRGNDPDNAHFAFGIHDDLMTQLQRIGDLKLIAASSVRTIDPDMSLQQAGLKLGAAYVMRGSVERVLDRIRVNVVLLDAAQEQQTWSGSFDRQLSAVNLFDIRDEITRVITGELQAVLAPEARSRVFDLPTTSLEASNHYARGRRLLVNRRPGEVMQAVEEFEAAVDIDPDYALAWAGLADALSLAFDAGQLGSEEYSEMHVRAVDRAMAVNDQLAEVWVAYGDSLRLRGRPWEEAIDAFEKAIELSPNYARAYHSYAMNVRGYENIELKLSLYQKAIELDPTHPIYQINMAYVLYGMDHEEEALQHSMALVESNPNFLGGYGFTARIHEWSGNIIEAIQWARKGLKVNPNSGHTLAQLAEYYFALKAWDHVDQVRQQMAERLDPGHWRVAMLDYNILRRQRDSQGQVALMEEFPYWDDQFIRFYRGLVHFDLGEMQEAREYWESLEPHSYFPEDYNCGYVQVILATGDEARGREMLEQALLFWEVTLPVTVPDAMRYGVLDGGHSAQRAICYLLDGQADKALDFYRRRVDLGYVHDWWEIKLNPLLDAYRDDPRFIAIDQQVEATIAEQRERLYEMDESENFVH